MRETWLKTPQRINMRAHQDHITHDFKPKSPKNPTAKTASSKSPIPPLLTTSQPHAKFPANEHKRRKAYPEG
jgi:hypothetical protein